MADERERNIDNLAIEIGSDVKEIFCNIKDVNVIPESGWILQYDSSLNCFRPSMRKIIESPSLDINTNNGNFQNKINETVNIQRPGRYKVTISFNYSLDSTSTDFEVFALFGNQTLSSAVAGRILQIEPKDAAGNYGDGRGTNQTLSYTNSYYVNVGFIGNTQAIVQFKPTGNGVEASMWDASINIEEIFV